MPVTISHPDVTFVTTAASVGRVESEITTAAPDDKVSFEFTVTRGTLTLRVGTASGDQDIVADIEYPPGYHIVSFTPGASPYYLQFAANDIGTALLTGFARLAAGTLDITAPWAAADISAIRMQQSLNVIWMAHRGYQTQVLERRGSTSWTLRDYAPTDGPFNPLNATDTTLTPDGLTGEITIDANAAIFTALDVGMLLKLTHSGQYETASVTALDGATDPIRVSGIEAARAFTYEVTGTFVGTVVLERSVGNTVNYQTVASVTGVTAATQLNDGYDNQVIYYRLRCSAYTSGTIGLALTYAQGVQDGVARIVSVDADNSVTADVIEPFSKTDATPLWYLGAWGDRFGWPAAVGMHDGRLGLARADQYWLSAADDFESHLIGANDADAISRTLTGKMNAIAWLKGVDKLLAGTIGAEHIITGGALEEVLTPATTYSKPLARRGSADTDAVIIDTSVAFINRTRERIYLAQPGSDGYSLVDLTRLHPGIGGASGFKEIAFQTEPYPRLWCVRNDGEIAILALDPAEQIAAWQRYTTPGGTFESVAVIPAGAEDGVYFAVDRGGATFLIEKLAMEDYTDLEDAWRLQSAVEYSGTAVSVLTGLTHLEGEEVYVWGNGNQYGPYTVASGQITVYEGDGITPASLTYAITGLLYEGKWKSARMDVGGQSGTALTLKKQIKRLGMLIYRTPGGMLKWGRDFTAANMTTLQDRVQAGLTYGGPLQERTEDINMTFDGKADEDARLCISMPGAGPATVLGLVPSVETNEG